MSQLIATNRYDFTSNADILGDNNLKNVGLGPINTNANDELNRTGQAYEFDGDTALDYLVDQNSRSLSINYTFETRLQYKSATGTIVSLGYRRSADPLTWMFIYIQGTNQTNAGSVALRIRNATHGQNVFKYTTDLRTSPYNLSDGDWFTITYRQTRLNSSGHAKVALWINGISEIDETIEQNVTASTNNRMGYGGAGDVGIAINYDKKISLSNIYEDKQLTDMQVLQNHKKIKLTGGF